MSADGERRQVGCTGRETWGHAQAGSFAGYLVSAHLADWLGRKATLILFAVGSFATVVVYNYSPIGNHLMLALGSPLGFFASGVFSPIGAFFTELFPNRLRGSGQGFSYSFGWALGAIFPALVGYLSATMPLDHAIGVFAVSAYALMILAVVFAPRNSRSGSPRFRLIRGCANSATPGTSAADKVAEDAVGYPRHNEYAASRTI